MKKAKIKAEKEAEAQAKKEARKAEAIARKAIQAQDRERKKAEAAARKAEAAANTAAKKTENKERKRVEAEEVSRKKLEDRVAKNVETALEKIQSTKRKAALSFIDPAPKKKQRIEEKSETIIKSEPDSGNSSEPKIVSTSTSKDKAKSERGIEDKSNVAK